MLVQCLQLAAMARGAHVLLAGAHHIVERLWQEENSSFTLLSA
jgi:hypothetical protein